MQENNEQLPVRDGEGYRFFEIIKFNERYVANENKFVFQPFVETAAFDLLKAGAENSGVTVNARVNWTEGNGKRSQDFEYSDEFVNAFIGSYNSTANSYSKVYFLTIKGIEQFTAPSCKSVLVSETGVVISGAGVSLSTGN